MCVCVCVRVCVCVYSLHATVEFFPSKFCFRSKKFCLASLTASNLERRDIHAVNTLHHNCCLVVQNYRCRHGWPIDIQILHYSLKKACKKLIASPINTKNIFFQVFYFKNVLLLCVQLHMA